VVFCSGNSDVSRRHRFRVFASMGVLPAISALVMLDKSILMAGMLSYPKRHGLVQKRKGPDVQYGAKLDGSVR